MNPLVAMRAVSAIALPLAAVIAYVERRRLRGPHIERAVDESRSAPSDPRTIRDAVAAGTSLRGADLRGANLDRTKLAGRDLRRANLTGALLRRSDLSGARLSGARLDHADLSECDLRDADLAGASLTETNLWKADVRGASFEDCGSLVRANLRGARYNRTTRWPDDIEPKAMGALLDK